jgi:hypothetical protein
MTHIELTPAELELIQAKRMEAEKKLADQQAKMQREIAERTALMQGYLNQKVAAAKKAYDTLCNNYNAMLTKGATAWQWSTDSKTFSETVRIYNNATNDYETYDTLTATVQTATLTNGVLKIQWTANGFASNIWKDRATKWNQYPKPYVSAASFGKEYSTLKKCIAVAEELQAEIAVAAARRTNAASLQIQAVNQLQTAHPTATVKADTLWDRQYNKDRQVVKVSLHNGIQMILEPTGTDNTGQLIYTRHSVVLPNIDVNTMIAAMNGITV